MTHSTRRLRLGRRSIIALAITIALGSASPAFAAPQGQETIAPPDLGQEETKILLTIAGDDGSATTIVPEIASKYLEFRGASGIRLTKADPPWTTEITGTMLNDERVAVLIRASSSTDGLSLLAAGMADIGLSIREAGPTELPDLTNSALSNDSAAVRAIALNGWVLIVNKATRVRFMSFDDARGIYTGKIQNWSEVGGTPGPIHYYGRAIDYRSNSLAGTAMGGAATASALRVVPSYSAMRDAVASDGGGIGYVPVNFIYHEHISWSGDVTPIRFKVGDRLGAMPNEYGLATGDYPLVFPHLIYRIPDRDSQEADSFFEQTESVSTLVINMFAGLTVAAPHLLVPIFDQPLPDRYRDMVRNSLRISTTVRFEADSTEIKSRTKRSLDDLAAFLRRLDVAPEQVQHLVFSEDTGNAEHNHEISERLGEVFVRELRVRNVRPGNVVALGAILPLGSDSTPLGQWLNRRVETWITP
jgi:phosphate transport system substrate-binding protein